MWILQFSTYSILTFEAFLLNVCFKCALPWFLLRCLQLGSPSCDSTHCDGRCGQDLRCSRDIRMSPSSIPCMVRRETVEERCYLGNDCPGAGCPYALTGDRAPGTMYIAVPALRHHIQMPTIMCRKGSPPFIGDSQSYRSHAYTPRRSMVNAYTQTTSDLLQDFVIIKKEPIDDSFRSECRCKCGGSYGSNAIACRDSKVTSVGV